MVLTIRPDSPDHLRQYDRVEIFLAGSIDNGSASLWAARVESMLQASEDRGEIPPVLLFNPRREKWNSELEQTPDNPEFLAQVHWELDNLTDCEIPFFYFEPGSVSPITLQELGYCIGMQATPFPPVVCCPDGFWRKGNVQIMCELHGIPVYDDLTSAIDALEMHIIDANEVFY